MVSIKDSLDKLELYLLELEEKYIDTHDDPLEDPDKYKLDVRSYCVLSHVSILFSALTHIIHKPTFAP